MKGSFEIKSILKLLFLSGMIVLLSDCKDEPKPPPNPIIESGKGVFVVNEGTFGMGNASLCYINFDDSATSTDLDLFKSANNRPLGDIFQSMMLVQSNAWLMVNNSGKIEIVSPKDSKSIATIKGLKSPRYALEVAPSKVYVTDLYANVIHIIDAKSFIKTGEIKCIGWTEDLLMDQNKVWVTNHNSSFVYIINPISDIISDSIKVAYGGSSILKDKNGKIWILCSGDIIKNKTGGLFCINPNSMIIEKQFLFASSSFNPIKIKQNMSNDTLYFINQGIYRMAKTDSKIPAEPFIAQPNSSSFYGLTIHPVNGKLIVADATDFVSRGRLNVYSSSGHLLKTYTTGIVPSEFMWW